jgi:hypothetical protein
MADSQNARIKPTPILALFLFLSAARFSRYLFGLGAPVPVPGTKNQTPGGSA